jgi:hypothetical protein
MTTKKNTTNKKVSRKKSPNDSTKGAEISNTSSYQKKEGEDINTENFIETKGTESYKSPSVQPGMMDMEGDYDQRDFDKQRIQSEFGSQRGNTEIESRDSEGYHNYFENSGNEDIHQGAHVRSRYESGEPRNYSRNEPDEFMERQQQGNEMYGSRGSSAYSSQQNQDYYNNQPTRSNYYESQYQQRPHTHWERENYHRGGSSYHEYEHPGRYENKNFERRNPRGYRESNEDFDRRNQMNQGNYNESRSGYQRMPENYPSRQEMYDDYYRGGRNPRNEGRSYESLGGNESYYEPNYERGRSYGWHENTRSYNQRNPRGYQENQGQYSAENYRSPRSHSHYRGGSNYGGGREEGYERSYGGNQNYDAPYGGYYSQGLNRGPEYRGGLNTRYGMNENWNTGNYGNRNYSQRERFDQDIERENRRRNDQENEVW